MRISSTIKSHLIAILLGWFGVLGTFFAFSASFTFHKITVVWSLFLPMMASLAFGWRTALAAATLGGASLFGFLLWPTNGWANIVNIPLYTAWFAWHGYCAERRTIKASTWNNLYVAQLLYTVFFVCILVLCYPISFAHNPPFWEPSAVKDIPPQVVRHIAFKESILLMLQILLCDLLLALPPVRRLFSLPTPHAARYNVRILFASIVVGAVVTAALLVLDAIMSHHDPSGLLIATASSETIHVIVIDSILIAIATRQLIQYVERRVAAEDTLRESEQKYRAIFDDSIAAIYAFDTSRKFIASNQAGLELLGYTRDELLSMSIPDVDADPLVVREAHQKLLSGGRLINYEHRLKRRDGAVVTVLNNSRPVANAQGRVVGMLSTLIDITDRKHAEDSRQREIAFSNAIIESLPGVFYICDARGTLIRWHGNERQELGYTDDELAASSIFNIMPVDQHDHVAAKFRHVLETGGAVFETALVTKSGSDVPFYFTGRRMAGDDGYLIVGVGIDLSERRRLEDQLRQAQKMEAIGQLAGGVAHDFNNSLTVFSTYGHMLRRRLADNERLREYADNIIEAAEKAKGLTQNLLTFSRKQALTLKPIELNSIVRKVEALLRSAIGEDIELVSRLTDDDMTVLADGAQLEQMLINLATNARDAMPQGGCLSLSIESVELGAAAVAAGEVDRPGTYVRLCIADTGCGMDRTTAERVFEPFFTTKESGKGTGLGLAIVYSSVKRHNGFIKVVSTLGKGTSFIIHLPRVSAPVSSPLAEVVPTVLGGSETILLAEDNADVRESIRLLLEDAGYTVIEAVDGDEAVSLFSRHQDAIALLMTDVIMPKRNGRQVYTALKALKPTIPAIFISGYTADIITSKGLLEEGLTLLHKPPDPDALRSAVRSLLDQKGYA